MADRLASLITRTPSYESENFWMEHSGTKWRRSPVWDKLFPKFEASSKEAAIRKYCEYYYQQAERLAADLEASFRFVELGRFSDPDYQSAVLSFAGIPSAEQVLTRVHVQNR